MALPPWVAPARRVVLSERCDVGGEGAMGRSDEQVHSWEACLLNVQGLDAGTRYDKKNSGQNISTEADTN